MTPSSILNKLAGLNNLNDEYDFTAGMPTNPEFAAALKAKQEKMRQDTISEAADVVMTLVRNSHNAIEVQRIRLANARTAERAAKNTIHVIAVLREYGSITMDYIGLAKVLDRRFEDQAVLEPEKYIENLNVSAMVTAKKNVANMLAKAAPKAAAAKTPKVN